MRVSWTAVLLLVSCNSDAAPRVDTARGRKEIRWGNKECRLRSGEVACRGDNSSGIVRAPRTDERVPEFTPIPLAEPAIDLGLSPLDHACAVGASGKVYCWGANTFGQLGGEPASSGNYAPEHVRAEPRAVEGVEGARQVALSGSATCIVDDSGRVTCWGALASLRIGIERTGTPTRVEVPGRVIAIAAELIQTCAATADAVFCWGGYLPHPATSGQPSARGVTRVPGIQGVITGLQAAAGRMCATLEAGAIQCWSTTPAPLE